MSLWTSLWGCRLRPGGRRYRTRICEMGEGPPLLLLHGNGGHVENFAANLPAYAARFRAIAFDFVWHGLADKPDVDPAIIPTLVDQVIDLMDAEGIARAHVEGQSMGGWVALALASRHPERVNRLVLTTAEGFGIPPERTPGVVGFDRQAVLRASLATLDDPSTANIRARLERLVVDASLIDDEMVEIRRRIYSDSKTNASLRAVATAYFTNDEVRAQLLGEDALRALRPPTLVYWGENNPTPPAVAAYAASLIPNADYYCAARTGHWAQFEHADEHNREVLRFLAGGDG